MISFDLKLPRYWDTKDRKYIAYLLFKDDSGRYKEDYIVLHIEAEAVDNYRVTDSNGKDWWSGLTHSEHFYIQDLIEAMGDTNAGRSGPGYDGEGTQEN